ncbi:MAG: hypothetical protein HQ485_08410 [Acidobacteria bacterium]|nr:hypothetical protein [Acidobacteriota bacterium]
MSLRFIGACSLASGAVLVGVGHTPVERLRPVDALPAHICGQFREPIGFAQLSTGQYLVLDRRAHTVFSVDQARTHVERLVQVGLDKGELLQPGVLSLAANDTFAVSDAPFAQERIQIFFDSGTRRGAFMRPVRAAPRLRIGPLILSGAGSLHYTGTSVLLNEPESGALIAELDVEGKVTRRTGSLRPTGHEADRQVHLALNLGLPIGTPDDGVLFVFQTGVPLFRKYSADGRLEFERHIEGPELDGYIQTLPTSWPTRETGDGTHPLVPPIVRTAALSSEGDLWVSLMPPLTYVYDQKGNKTRTVSFNAAGVLSPTSLFFSTVSGTERILVMPGCYEFPASPQ